MKVTHKAHLRGFSIQRPKRRGMPVVRATFAGSHSSVTDFEVTLRAFQTKRPFLTRVGGLSHFDDQNYIVAAEPMVTGAVPRQIVMTAVRRDCERLVHPWVARLGVAVDSGLFQKA
jgi:hypothetical protein